MSELIQHLRPSSAHTWVICHGYAAMRAAYPEAPDEADNDVREDGIACHWLANELFHKRYPEQDSFSPNNRLLTEEMFEAADEYLSVLQSWGTDVEVYAETPVVRSYLHPLAPSGTPDAWCYSRYRNLLRIADLKYGFRFVEAWYNWQLIDYACALIERLGLSDLDLTVEFTIVQSRSSHRDGPVRKWVIKATELRGYRNALQDAFAQAIKPNPKCTPNPGCYDCGGRHACQAFHQASLQAIEVAYDGTPIELSPEALGSELRLVEDAISKLEGRKTGLATQAERLIKSGAIVPHWQLAATFSRKAWRDPSQVMSLGLLYGANLVKPPKPITPNQAEKLIPAAVVAQFSHQPSTGVKLVRQDPYEARKKFDSQPKV